jgi:cardiolipin synthase
VNPLRKLLPDRPLKELFQSKAMRVIGAIALLVVAGLLVLALFEPGLRYKTGQIADETDQEAFFRMLEAVTDSRLQRFNRIEVLSNGETFYPAELEAMRQAKQSIDLEAYIFEKGDITKKVLDVLTERARAGVKVKLVVDGLGSFSTTSNYFDDLKKAGGKFGWYHPVRWYTWPRYNNRTHREITIIDGRIAFLGGAGYADHWWEAKKGKPRWRDTMIRVEGPVVNSLQGTFSENWLESTGEILSDEDYFPKIEPQGSVPALVVNSSPSKGRSTRARVLFQTLIASAKKSIYITTPYFLPDDSGIDELKKARERGVEVRVLTTGPKTDHNLTRYSSRTLYGDLISHGIHIYEYQPAMIHAKVLMIDGEWSVLGSTNMDNRSFGLNDEINLAAYDQALTKRLEQDFFHDLELSREMTAADMKKRSPWERLEGWFGLLIERQQ